ncbi:MAG: AAA family ATPase [Bdellovibrionota bacterium]
MTEPNLLADVLSSLKSIEARTRLTLPESRRSGVIAELNQDVRAIIITGARGVGKTTLILQNYPQEDFLYFSADNPIIAGCSLYDIGEAAFMQGYRGVLIDEVHYAKDWSINLKALYDAFPRKKICASDSSAIILRKGMGDLSRRFLVRKLPLLSFREYLILSGVCASLPQIDPFSADKKSIQSVLSKINVMKHFKQYLQMGFRPFFLEGMAQYQEKLVGTIEKTLTQDIPFLVPQLSENHFRLMSAVIGYLAKSSVPTLAVNSLCNEWEIGKEKLYQLLQALEVAQVIRIIRKPKDHRLHSIGAKIFLHEPATYEALAGNTGSVREAYCAAAFQEAGYTVHAAMDEKGYDMIIDGKTTIEIGGATKKRKKADFMIRDGTDVPTTGVIPMWLLGFAW